MDYAKAKGIAESYAPNLIIDDQHGELKNMLGVRKSKNGGPFSIALTTVDKSTIDPTDEKTVDQIADEQELKLLTDALDGACRHFGIERGA